MPNIVAEEGVAVPIRRGRSERTSSRPDLTQVSKKMTDSEKVTRFEDDDAFEEDDAFEGAFE